MTKNNKNIVLIGFMGVGKTSVGRLLSQKINYNFIDTDFEIEKESSMTVEEIFSKYGEEYFRELERRVVAKVSKYSNTVVSTGGGTVLNFENIQMLRQNGFIFLLKAFPETILKNIQRQGNRPLLKEKEGIKRIKDLLKEREEKYKYFDYEISVDNLSVEQIVDRMIEVLKEKKIYGC